MRLAEILSAWLAYFALHSLLAASPIKAIAARRWPQLMPGYRVFYNAVATLALLPILWLVYSTESAWLWQWRGAWAWLSRAVALAAILCFIFSARSYNLGEFIGLRQLQARNNDVAESFRISFFHRFVRHPWYCFALALIWTRDINAPLLVSALAITIYFVVGSMLEEQKLIASYGDSYRRYKAAVPGLIPLPWKTLSADEARELTNRPGRPG